MDYIGVCLERIAATFFMFYWNIYQSNKEQSLNYPEFCFSIAVSNDSSIKPHRLAIGSMYANDDVIQASQRLFESYGIPLAECHKESLLGVGWDFASKIVKVYSTQLLQFAQLDNLDKAPYRRDILYSESFNLHSKLQVERKYYLYPVKMVQVSPDQQCECAVMISDKRGTVWQYDMPFTKDEILSQTYQHPLPWKLSQKAQDIVNFHAKYKCLLYCIEPGEKSTTLYLPFNF